MDLDEPYQMDYLESEGEGGGEDVGVFEKRSKGTHVVVDCIQRVDYKSWDIRSTPLFYKGDTVGTNSFTHTLTFPWPSVIR